MSSIPRFSVDDFPEPRKLMARVRKLQISPDIPQVREDNLEVLATQIRQKAQQNSTWNPSRREKQTLTHFLAEVASDNAVTREVLQILLRTPNTTTKLWELWERHEAHIDLLAIPLMSRLRKKFSSSASEFALKWRPKWLPLNDDGIQILRSPVPTLKHWVISTKTLLPDVMSKTGLSTKGWPAQKLLKELIKAAPQFWWERNNKNQILEWGRDHLNDIQKRLLAERLLLEAGEGASGALHFQGRAETTRPLVKWCLDELSDPRESLGVWRGVSERAVQVLKWMLLEEQLAKILSQFRSGAELDRAQYWEKKLGKMTDALFYEHKTSAVCIMVFPNILVVEFGTNGNAAYFYAPPRGPLRRKMFLGFSISDFKKPFLKAGSEQLKRLDRKSHQGTWQPRFDAFFEELSIEG